MLPWRLAGGCRGGRLDAAVEAGWTLAWRLAGGCRGGWPALPWRLAGSSHPCVGLFCLSVLPVRNQKKNLSKKI